MQNYKNVISANVNTIINDYNNHVNLAMQIFGIQTNAPNKLSKQAVFLLFFGYTGKDEQSNEFKNLKRKLQRHNIIVQSMGNSTSIEVNNLKNYNL